MGETTLEILNNYSPIGDILTIGIILVCIFFLRLVVISKSKSYSIFRGMIAMLLVGSICGIIYHLILDRNGVTYPIPLYILRYVYHMLLFGNMFLYILYYLQPLHLTPKERHGITRTATVGLGILSVFGFVEPFLPYGEGMWENGLTRGINMFSVGYMFFTVVLMYVLIRYHNRLVRQMVYGALTLCGLQVIMFSVQGLQNQVSFTSAIYLFPMLMLMYMVHSNPYNMEIGAVGPGSFYTMIRESYRQDRELVIMSLFLPDFETGFKEYPKEFQDTARRFGTEYFGMGTVLFQMSSGRITMTIDTAKAPTWENGINHMLTAFSEQYEVFKLDFQIVITKTDELLSQTNDYISFMEFVESRIPMNDVHFCDEADINEFFKQRHILGQLEEIDGNHDLDDARVQGYRQPVFNITTGRYDTAEALMRLKLDDGMVYPDVFIPLAEQKNYIHTLSLIILHKTCKQIRKMLDMGLEVKRISVNFAVSEVRDPDFCEDVQQIIDMHSIPYDKIAIEITESQNESDFLIIKDRINQLRSRGIKFYLDDFGTGYSNFERIMELPFDIIKFDRSLVIASGGDAKSEMMVSYLAKMFDSLEYSVLYEGVETELDEEMCKKMCAKYLQGYKYSKPIPIEQLDEYFDHTA